MNKNSYYAFYGSLRQGMYNHTLFQNHLNYLFTENLKRYRLHALQYYPIAVKSDSPTDQIKIEVMQITDLEIETKIHQMEIGAGYFYDEVKVKNLVVGIYLFENPRHFPLVENGDWVEFFNKNN